MKKLPAIIFFILSGIQSYCQNVELNGRIEDLQTHKALPYATLEVFSLKTGTIADRNGDFKLTVSSANLVVDTLIFSCLGYEKIKIPMAVYISSQLYAPGELLLATNGPPFPSTTKAISTP